MWELGHKESWVPKNWCFWTVVLERTLESPLDCKEIQQVNPKGNQSWIFIGRTDAEAPILWPPNAKSWLIGKDPDAGKDWRQEEKETTEDEMIGWHHRLDGHEFEQAPGVGDGQGSLACNSPWGLRESDMTKQLNWTDWFSIHIIIYVYSPYLKLCAYILHICNYTHTQIGQKYLTWQSELKMDVRFWKVRTSWNLQAQFCWTDWNSLPLTFVQGCPIEFRALCPTFKLIHIYVFTYLAQKSKEPMADMGNGGAVSGPGSVPTKDGHPQISNSQHLVWAAKMPDFLLPSIPHTASLLGLPSATAWRKTDCGKCNSA